MRAVIYARYSARTSARPRSRTRSGSAAHVSTQEGWTYRARLHAIARISGASTLAARLSEAARGRARRPVRCRRRGGARPPVARPGGRRGALQAPGFAGVGVVTLAEGEISELHVGLKGTMNALFLKDLAREDPARPRGPRAAGPLRRRPLLRLRRRPRELGADGEPVAGRAPHQRGGGRRSCAASSRTTRPASRPSAIASALNAERHRRARAAAPGAPPRSTATRPRGTGILNNELYIGRLVWNRLRYVKDPADRQTRLASQSSSGLDRHGGAGAPDRRSGRSGMR